METSKLSLLLSLAGAAALQLHAQPASPEAQNRALELLRQTISQEQFQTPSAAQPAALTPAPIMTTAPAAPASTDQQQQAIMLLRQAMAEQPQTAAPAPAPKAKASSSAKGAKPSASASKSPSVQPAPAPEAVTPAPTAPAGPKTKQQRLADLLQDYRADKLTPAQYQAERAKILAEP